MASVGRKINRKFKKQVSRSVDKLEKKGLSNMSKQDVDLLKFDRRAGKKTRVDVDATERAPIKRKTNDTMDFDLDIKLDDIPTMDPNYNKVASDALEEADELKDKIDKARGYRRLGRDHKQSVNRERRKVKGRPEQKTTQPVNKDVSSKIKELEELSSKGKTNRRAGKDKQSVDGERRKVKGRPGQEEDRKFFTNDNIKKTVGLGVGGALIFNMFDKGGQMSNAELYGQQSPYGY